MPELWESTTKGKIVDILSTANRVLYLRMDGIGDSVLANGALERLVNMMPQAEISAVCDTLAAPIYEAGPLVRQTVPLSRWGLADEDYLSGAVKLIRKLKPDAVLNITHSGTREHCLLALSLGVPVIALENDLSNMGLEEKNFFASKMLCIPSPPEEWNEMERYAAMLERLGLSGAGLEPVMWLAEEDRQKAVGIWEETGFSPEKTIALFGAGSSFLRAYLDFGPALVDICRARGFSVVTLGSNVDAIVNEHLLKSLLAAGIPARDLAGALSLRESAAVLAGCALVVGVETGLAHIASALGVPQVIVLGGGHFGRFMPVHPSTTAVVIPLECFNCNWSCKYDRPHCVRGITPETVTRAVEHRLEMRRAVPRRTLFMQKPQAWSPRLGWPAWRSPSRYIHAGASWAGNELDIVTGG